jgi:5-methylthioadenosine/S-adenosylhomocysteine deaminase
MAQLGRSSLVRGKYVIVRAGADNDSSEVISDGAVFQRDGVIQDVGDYATMKAKHQADEEIGGPNFLVSPGLVNAHHHGRGITTIQMGTPDDSLETWIVNGWARRPIDNYMMTLYTALQMLESGTTTVMYNHTQTPVATVESDVDDVLRAFNDAGMRVAFSVYHRTQNRVVYGDDKAFVDSLPADLGERVWRHLGAGTLTDDEYFELFQRVHAKYGTDPESRVRVLLSPSNVHWTSDEFLQRTKELAQHYQTGIHLHLVESYYQRHYGTRHWGKTPLAHLDELGFLGPEVSYAHGVWLTEPNLRLLADHGGTVCHNASSNLRLKNGIAPVNQMLQHGVNVAMGTDSDGINDDDDMVQEMRLVSKLHRQPGIGAPALTSAQVMKMATVNGSSPTFFGNQVGVLEQGSRADMVLTDLAHIEDPFMHPDVNPIDAFMHRGKSRYVDTVIIDGEVVLREGRSTRVDRSDLMAQIKESLAGPPPERVLETERMVRELQPHVEAFYADWTQD